MIGSTNWIRTFIIASPTIIPKNFHTSWHSNPKIITSKPLITHMKTSTFISRYSRFLARVFTCLIKLNSTQIQTQRNIKVKNTQSSSQKEQRRTQKQNRYTHPFSNNRICNFFLLQTFNQYPYSLPNTVHVKDNKQDND